MSHKNHTLNSLRLIFVSIILVFAFYWGLNGIKANPIFRDELTTLGHIGALTYDTVTLADTVSLLSTYSYEHPPTYYLIANIWGNLFSFEHYIVFLPSLLFGILSLAVTYRLTVELSTKNVALITLLITATSIMYIHYSHELRQYSSLMFWAGGIWLIYSHAIRYKKSLPVVQRLLLTITTVCFVYTHYSAMFLLIVMGVYHLLFVPKTKVWWQVSLSIIVAGLFFVPWLPNVLASVGRNNDIQATGADDTLLNADLIRVVPEFWSNGSVLLFISTMLLSSIAVVRNQYKSRYVMFFFILMALLILIVNEQLQFVKQLRYLIFLLPALYILWGIGLSQLLSNKFVGYVLIFIFMIVWVISGTQYQTSAEFYYQTALESNQDYLEYQLLAPLVRDVIPSGELLILDITDFKELKHSKQGWWSPYQYYMKPINIDTFAVHSSPEQGTFRINRLLERVEARDQFWLTYRHKYSDDLTTFLNTIAIDYKLCKEIPYGDDSFLDYYVSMDQYPLLCRS